MRGGLETARITGKQKANGDGSRQSLVEQATHPARLFIGIDLPDRYR